MNRSQSVGSKMNVTFQDVPIGMVDNSSRIEGSLALVDSSMDNSSFLHRPGSMTDKTLMSNSMVSLQSVCLNEDFIKDTQVLERDRELGKMDGEGEVRKRVIGGEKMSEKEDGKTLAEIDRFSMCSNRII